MNPDRWQQISQVYHAALGRPAPDRAGFLRAACGGDDALQQEVASLLSNERDAAGFLLSAPLENVAASSITVVLNWAAGLKKLAGPHIFAHVLRGY